ncbi:MAG: class I SAM-dependent methyltransferase [Caldilineaceae bacterium SB0668_bin_21]|nr:class I SAM-dependent methyltransferase [Caldilineaceae bacterium SB0668_bin_21]MYC21755.1 class I SAM-dependent methyltransferase [Caldilineaceae bacterium SB0662_bin_25]
MGHHAVADYTSVTSELKRAYDAKAEERDRKPVLGWRQALWAEFLQRLQAENLASLLEIGAGTGQAGTFFQEGGLKVVCTDLSPEMVRLCRAKGLEAYEMDFLHLDFPDDHFDGLFAQNCLLHVPKVDFANVLQEIGRVVRSEGLIFILMHGGRSFEGVREEDFYEPKRFYALYADDELQLILERFFQVISFQVIMREESSANSFQAVTLRNQS